MIVDLKENKLAMWAVCEAIGSQHELIDKMESIETEGEKILKEIKFIVGGVELNFLNVIKAIDNNVMFMINKKATELIEEKFDGIINTLEDVKSNIIDKIDID